MRTTIATLFLITAGIGHAQEMNIPHQKHVLENGLQVVLHEDHSDPVVAFFITYHVGSAREEVGRSGFAHLFEHMLFQGSENVGDDKHFKLISEAGGTLNGTTNQDRTLYYEVLPSNQLELAFWLEADRMGFLLPAVTQEKLDNQRDVVKNERRQNYENRPYGQARGAIAAAMYPSDHPYSWITIGSQEDLSAATLDDVHGFFRRWYAPNNATLAIGGDIDPDEALRLANKYFGSIPRGPEVEKPEPRQVRLERSKRLALEDRVKLPRLMLTWHTTPAHSADDAALQMLSSILSANKSSILDKALTVDDVLASSVYAANMPSELAGLFQISVTAAPGVTLDDLELRVNTLLEDLARDGVDAEQLQRMKTRYEARFLRGFETVSGKTRALAEYNMYLDDPDFAAKELEGVLAVTPEDVERVLGQYILGQPFVALSVVPEGEIALAASGRSPEQLATETGFDRTVQPEPKAALTFHSPAVWHDTLASGIRVTGSPYSEIPMTQLALSFPGGSLQETMDTLGTSSLLAELLQEGTARLSTTELTEAFDALGASLSIRSDDDEITLTLSALDKHLEQAALLLTEILLEPRFDPTDFERLKKQRLISIDSRAQNIGAVAGAVFQRLMFGDSVRGMPSRGTRETVEALSLEDVRSFFERTANPAESRLVIVGSADAPRVRELFGALDDRWKPTGAEAIHSNARLAAGPKKPGIYLVDKPGATQSQIRIGHMSVASGDPDYYALTVMNYPLGGAFSSRINMNLREDKGYTYGARSSFRGGLQPSPFAASAGVHTQYTAESVTEFLAELEGVRDGLSEEELAFTRNALIQAASRRYESMGALLGFLDNVSLYGWSDTYPEERIEELRAMDKARLDGLVHEHVRPDSFVILVVGDSAEILEGLEALQLGPITLLDIDGAPLEDDS